MINKQLLLNWLNTRIDNLEHSARLYKDAVPGYGTMIARADALRFVRSEIEAGGFDYREDDNPRDKGGES